MDRLCRHLLTLGERAFAIQEALTAVPALGPENGGQGELAKARLTADFLRSAGIDDILELNSPDPRVESGIRPNLVARVKGQCAPTLWLFGHLDIVPPGAGWQTDPWTASRDGDIIRGRGVEDNQQAITSMILLVESLHELKITPRHSLGLVFMADEECGSKHGLAHILKEAPELFAREDWFIVPDGGSADAASVEVAEKAQLWLKISVQGKQCHASAPQNGINALEAASKLIASLDELRRCFVERDELFSPPCSTFVPTRQEGNDAAVNILPGKDCFYLDCRLLPNVSRADALAKIGSLADEITRQTGASIDIDIIQEQAASFTPPKSQVVERLGQAIAAIYGVEAKPCGIGGATVAALLRQAGLPAAVWACLLNTCHQPNECSSLLATCRDAAVFGHILQSE